MLPGWLLASDLTLSLPELSSPRMATPATEEHAVAQMCALYGLMRAGGEVAG